ncbi:hypothetical protein BJF79_23150 [Actinomadura sp. CNU-125]|uniref:phospholipase D-like domain-containing protein n=1 Tax=Actinomadura sp. CNU-125 TaxID=1904961 RepID=UPI00095AAFA7|nr:phospholipase D-like domain-containing protein [Actinomadura sp. CNU-125]OLT11925.1 hypothetical protein BJF79_23150 [Actinomadura sp. CNU-125]
MPLTNTATFNSLGGSEIVNHLLELIRGAEPGSEIKFTAFRFEERSVADALIDAARRGVQVQLLVDGGAPTSDGQQYIPVEAALATDNDDGTWARHCGGAENPFPEPSCQGTNAMHNKFALFSRTMGTDDVVSTGSANLNDTSGRTVWNSWYTHVENSGLFERFKGYFGDMARMEVKPDYYNENPPVITGNVKSYFYPRAKVDGDAAANDTFVHTLDATRCPGTIRVANWSLSRPAVAHALVAKAAEGCTVEVVARKIYPSACKALATAVEAGAEVRLWSYKEEDEAPNYVHSKDATIEAGYPNTSEKAKVVFTGSANLNTPSLEHNDENVVRIMNQETTYAAFVDHFMRVKAHAESSGQGFRILGTEDCAPA